MSHNDQQLSNTMEENIELKDEVHTLHPPQPETVLPKMSRILAEIGPLPREALFLGVAKDGLPVLLNLHDPLPGPLLVTGETGSGKTDFLRSIVRSLVQTHQPNDLQYGVITNNLDEWTEVENTNHSVGVFSANDKSAQDLILSMTAWAHENKRARQSVLLLVDDLETIAKLEFDVLQNFRWLLSHGPSRRVWPVVTMDAERYGQVLSWIPLFRTRIFGCIANDRVGSALGGDKVSALDKLTAPNQFALRENDSWIRFLRLK
jgi:hypothetical protein